MDELVDAFARGDYRSVREQAPRVMRSAEPEDVRDAARKLFDRTRPDPLAVALLAMTAALLALVTAYWVAHGTPPKTPNASARSSRAAT
ncbi:MAG: hypothetical protein M3O36_16240 [Myxococcota bacterium]|nr:hypothetical protein [Myxococcota bacterium]